MSSSLSLEVLKAKADALAEEIAAVVPDISLMYVVHRNGQLSGLLSTMKELILEHPAGHLALRLLKRQFPAVEPSSFQGMAVTMVSPWLSLHHEYAMLGIISINIDSYKTFEDSLLDLFRQTWRALETADLCMEVRHTINSRGQFVMPKFDLVGEARSNMCGDVFATFMMHSEGYEDTLDRLARHRCRDAIQKSPTALHPELFPFPLVKETVRFACDTLAKEEQEEIPRIETAKNFTMEISDITSDRQIQHWWRFCLPAQDMVWRGLKSDFVLGAALFTCEDPYIRSIVHLVTETLDMKPATTEQLALIYNPFIDGERNMASHIKMVTEAFDQALTQAVSQNNSEPLYAEANRQNLKLLEGHFLGWCASSLQAAARSFDQALETGKPAAQSAKLEFESARSEVSMDSLRLLTAEIIKMKKVNANISVAEVLDLCMRQANFSSISKSIDTTVKSLQKRKGYTGDGSSDIEYHSYFIIDETEDFAAAQSSATWTTSMTSQPAEGEKASAAKIELSQGDTGLMLDEEETPPHEEKKKE